MSLYRIPIKTDRAFSRARRKKGGRRAVGPECRGDERRSASTCPPPPIELDATLDEWVPESAEDAIIARFFAGDLPRARRRNSAMVDKLAISDL